MRPLLSPQDQGNLCSATGLFMLGLVSFSPSHTYNSLSRSLFFISLAILTFLFCSVAGALRVRLARRTMFSVNTSDIERSDDSFGRR